MNKISVFSIALSFTIFGSACNQKQPVDTVKETRTSGTAEILVDEDYANLIEDQIEVFKTDYPDAEIKLTMGNENEILPKFISGETKMIVMTRMLKPHEERFYKQRQSPIYTDRIAVDGIALIVNKRSADTTISVADAYAIMRGSSTSSKQLVFDNAYSSTIRYFIDSAGVKELPKKGVYTLKHPKDVIKFVAENENFIGVIGVNWLLENTKNSSELINEVSVLGVRNQEVKDSSGVYYKPTQQNLINGKYPFLRNIYILNAEGTGGLGTGFANWLASPRGQLIVLKSGLAPHEIASREINMKTTIKTK